MVEVNMKDNHSTIEGISSLTSSEARMRRRNILNSQRHSSNMQPVPVLSSDEYIPITTKRKQEELELRQEQQPDQVSSAAQISLEGNNQSVEKRRKSNHKYFPDKPMSKEEETSWRREARRVRNRESARASRTRVQNQILGLEKEVEHWKNMYYDLQYKVENSPVVTENNHMIDDDVTLSSCHTPELTPSSSLLYRDEDQYAALDEDLSHLDLILSDDSVVLDDDFSDLSEILSEPAAGSEIFLNN